MYAMVKDLKQIIIYGNTNNFSQSLFLSKQSYFCKPMEKKLFKETKMRLKDGRYCSDEQKLIEMSIDRCKLLEMQLQTERRKVIALTERNVQVEKKYNELVSKLKELVGLC